MKHFDDLNVLLSSEGRGIGMTRYLIYILMFLMIVSGCHPKTSQEVSEPPKVPQTEQEKPAKVSHLTISRENFDRVVGWITNEEILYVTRQKSQSSLRIYDTEKGESKEVTKISEPILEVRIHPDFTKLAVVTSSNSLSATIHIFSVAGEKIDELTIESSEIYWDWNSTNNDQLFFSAFYEDWTFDSFVYSSNTKKLNRIETKDPFGKWAYDSAIQTINWPENDALSGGSLRQFNSETMSFQDSADTTIIYVESYKESNLIVRISEDHQKFLYTLTNSKDGESTQFELPAISNYSQWFVPEVEWLDDGSIVTLEAKDSGLMDTIPNDFTVVYLNHEVKTSIWEGRYEPLTCSPSGHACLIGMELEGMLEVGSNELKSWLEIIE